MKPVVTIVLLSLLLFFFASQSPALQTIRVMVSGGEMVFDPRTIPSEIQPGYNTFRKFCLECHGEERVIVTLKTGKSSLTRERYGVDEFRQKIIKILRGSKTDLDREAAQELLKFFTYLITKAKLA